MRTRGRALATAVAFTVGAVITLSGCSRTHPVGPAPAGASSTTQTIQVDGVARTFHVYRPATLTAPAPLVVFLHGGFGTGSQAESSYGWDAKADAEGFVVAYPDGLNRAWDVGGGCCGTPGKTGVDDVRFITRVVSTLEAQLPIDPRRVFATGISNGGLLAYRLACDTDVFAAIGPDSATLLGTCPQPARVSVIHVHGTADRNIPYDGGVGDGVAKIDGPAVPALVATWRAADGCAAPTSSTAGAVTTSVATCPDGRAVELVTIAGAGHQWPGGASKPLLEKALGLDPPSTAIDATDTIWAFFAAHPKPVT